MTSPMASLWGKTSEMTLHDLGVGFGGAVAPLKPPEHVEAARAAWQNAEQTMHEAPDLAAARAAATDAIIAAAGAGKPLDLAKTAGPLREAVLSAVAADEMRLALSSATDQLARRYAQTVAGWLPTVVVEHLRPAYLAAAAVVDEASDVVPLSYGSDEAIAEPHSPRAEAWRRTVEAGNLMYRLAEKVLEWRRVGLMADSRRDPAAKFLMIANPYAVDDTRLITVAGVGGAISDAVRSTLPDQPHHCLLELSRRGAVWHLPLAVEQDAAAGAWLEAEPSVKARMSGDAA